MMFLMRVRARRATSVINDKMTLFFLCQKLLQKEWDPGPIRIVKQIVNRFLSRIYEQYKQALSIASLSQVD